MRTMLGRRTFLAAVAGAAIAAKAAPAASGWISLLDGKTLTGWRTEGRADWTVRDGAIVGRPGAGGGVGELLTEKQWTNFELEAEWSMRWPGNSGIWFRYSGPNSAYQADILEEPSYPGVLSGSLYCMGKAFIAKNGDVKSIHKDGWNKLRIRAVGDSITIEQNGRKVVDIRDNTFPGPGSVGIQVHTGKQFANMEIRVRKIRLREL